MFDNVGGKIKGVAAVITWIGIVSSCIGGISVMSIGDEMIVPGFLIVVLGCLGSWLGSLALYGFGQLVESAESIDNRLKKLSAVKVEVPKADQNATPSPASSTVPANENAENTSIVNEENESEDDESNDSIGIAICIGIIGAILLVILLLSAVL